MAMFRRTYRRSSFDMGSLPPDTDPNIYYVEDMYKDNYGRLTLDKSFFNPADKQDTPTRELPGLAPHLPATFSMLNVINYIPCADISTRYEYWHFSFPCFPVLHDLPGLPYMIAQLDFCGTDKQTVDLLVRFTSESNNMQVQRAKNALNAAKETTHFFAARRGQKWGEEWNVKLLLQHCTMGWLEDVIPGMYKGLPAPREGFDICLFILEKQFTQSGYGGYGNGYYNEGSYGHYNQGYNQGYHQGYGSYDGHGQHYHSRNNSSSQGSDDGYDDNVKNNSIWTRQGYSKGNQYHEDYNQTVYQRQESPSRGRRGSNTTLRDGRNSSPCGSGSSTETMLSPLRDASPEPLDASPPARPGRRGNTAHETHDLFEDASEDYMDFETEEDHSYYSGRSPSPQNTGVRRFGTDEGY